MIHLSLHLIVPLGVALALFRPRWRGAFVLLLATMAVDVDHLLADPIYDPARCSIGFHPLHTAPAIGVYVGALVAAWLVLRLRPTRVERARTAAVVALGLLIHMALDWGDCLM